MNCISLQKSNSKAKVLCKKFSCFLVLVTLFSCGLVDYIVIKVNYLSQVLMMTTWTHGFKVWQTLRHMRIENKQMSSISLILFSPLHQNLFEGTEENILRKYVAARLGKSEVPQPYTRAQPNNILLSNSVVFLWKVR